MLPLGIRGRVSMTNGGRTIVPFLFDFNELTSILPPTSPEDRHAALEQRRSADPAIPGDRKA